MQARHYDSKRYFLEQGITTKKYVIPYISDVLKIDKNTRVLEIGCSMGGNLTPFLEIGCPVTGIDISKHGIDLANEYLADYVKTGQLKLICDDVYNRSSSDGTFDVIIMRDVIEHIHNQEKFLAFAKQFMAPGAVFFQAFPPWYNPFGGHQQVCKNRFLSKLPYFHILPTFLYKSILKVFGESEKTIEDLLEIKQTGISLERFERILKTEQYVTNKKTWYFINPNYETKFGLKPRVQSPILTFFPFIRNFFVTAGYYVISLNSKK
jgi:2-polyprenyl-3-methyl-5-hydroxy-6-metoxy-1,4-benzoquinol methylase